MITGIDHIQLAIPPGGEAKARPFWCGILNFTEIEKPEALKTSGGAWFVYGPVHLHLGVQVDFVPAKKAHPAFLVDSLAQIRKTFEQHDISIQVDPRTPELPRFYVSDPFGNRIEFIEKGAGFSESDSDGLKN